MCNVIEEYKAIVVGQRTRVKSEKNRNIEIGIGIGIGIINKPVYFSAPSMLALG